MHFTIFTDCSAIRATALKKDLHPRVARWWVKLQDYDFTIEYRPGSKMAHVDYLNRNPLDKVCTVRVTKPELTAIDSLREERTRPKVFRASNPASTGYVFVPRQIFSYRLGEVHRQDALATNGAISKKMHQELSSVCPGEVPHRTSSWPLATR
jgi:hypothetical protein